MKPTPQLAVALFLCALFGAAQAADQDTDVRVTQVQQTVIRMELLPDVTFARAVEAMTQKAKSLHLASLGHQRLDTKAQMEGRKPHLEILQFCDPGDALAMVKINPLLAAYLPCRIALTSDQQGRRWILMPNYDILVENRSLPPRLQEIAIRINQKLLMVMTAGATGGS